MGYQTQIIRLFGGRLCLDFVNTADWNHDGSVFDEKLETAADLSLWCQAIGLDAGAADVDDRAMAALRDFRRSLRRVFVAAASEQKLGKTDLKCLNRTLSSLGCDVLVPGAGGAFSFGADVGVEQAVAVSAASLLCNRDELARVRICPGDPCAWLFVDESRNGRRRWCSMETCGNRDKARRHYDRVKRGQASDDGRKRSGR